MGPSYRRRLSVPARRGNLPAWKCRYFRSPALAAPDPLLSGDVALLGGAREVQRIRPLTRAIQQLEEELGGLLLRRERKLTHLTDFGRLLEPHLRQLAADAEAARTATLSANQSSCAATGLAGVLRSILH
jgi:hypothetical protein